MGRVGDRPWQGAGDTNDEGAGRLNRGAGARPGGTRPVSSTSAASLCRHLSTVQHEASTLMRSEVTSVIFLPVTVARAAATEGGTRRTFIRICGLACPLTVVPRVHLADLANAVRSANASAPTCPRTLGMVK